MCNCDNWDNWCVYVTHQWKTVKEGAKYHQILFRQCKDLFWSYRRSARRVLACVECRSSPRTYTFHCKPCVLGVHTHAYSAWNALALVSLLS